MQQFSACQESVLSNMIFRITACTAISIYSDSSSNVTKSSTFDFCFCAVQIACLLLTKVVGVVSLVEVMKFSGC